MSKCGGHSGRDLVPVCCGIVDNTRTPIVSVLSAPVPVGSPRACHSVLHGLPKTLEGIRRTIDSAQSPGLPIYCVSM